MNIAVPSHHGTAAQLLVRPAPQHNPDDAAVVVRMPSLSPVPSQQQQPGRQAAQNVKALDPVAAEQGVVAEMACKVAMASLEVLYGSRSIQQLSRWLSTKCMNALTTRARLYSEAARLTARQQSQLAEQGNVVRLFHHPLIHSVHCSAVRPGVYETSVVVADAARFRAIAMRFEKAGGLWKVTALQMG